MPNYVETVSHQCMRIKNIEEIQHQERPSSQKLWRQLNSRESAHLSYSKLMQIYKSDFKLYDANGNCATFRHIYQANLTYTHKMLLSSHFLLKQNLFSDTLALGENLSTVKL